MQYANVLAGRVGQDVQLRHTSKNLPVCDVSVAEDRPVKKGEQWDNETVWHRFTAWGRVAERAAHLLRSGSLVLFHFRIDYTKKSVKNKDGFYDENVPRLVMTGFTGLSNYGKGANAPP